MLGPVLNVWQMHHSGDDITQAAVNGTQLKDHTHPVDASATAGYQISQSGQETVA